MRQVRKKIEFADLFRVNKQTSAKITTMSLLVIIFGLSLWPMVCINAGKAPPPIFINKCCRIGEKLDGNKECSFGGTDRWWPVIFLMMKQTYFEPSGEAPRFFKVNESTRPHCDSPELISGEHRVALFSNGTLYLPDRAKLIESGNYCVDKDVALVCNQPVHNDNFIDRPSNQILVRKCCPKNAIYQANTSCVILGDGITERKLVESSVNTLEYRYEFPHCIKNTNDIISVGKFNESKFDEDTGNLTLAGGVLQSDQYCLEHLNDNGNISVHVLTCVEYLPASEQSKKVYNIRINQAVTRSIYFQVLISSNNPKVFFRFYYLVSFEK